MPESTIQSSSVTSQDAAVSNAVFSLETNQAVNNVISIAEARARFSSSVMNAQGLIAFGKDMLGKIGIQGVYKAEDAANLVRFKTMNATKESSHKELKKAA